MKKLGIILLTFISLISYGQITITQNVDPVTVLTGNSMSCGVQGEYTLHNIISRSFVLEDYDITGDFVVTSMTFALEGLTGDLPFTLKLSTTDAPYPTGNLTLLAQEVVNLTPEDSDAVYEYIFPAPVTVPAGSELVVSYEANGQNALAVWFPGSNNAGETVPSYIQAYLCGVSTPMPFSSIGFPNIHVIFTLKGDTSMRTVEMGGNSLSVYPNPATDIINIALENGLKTKSMELINLAGETVLKVEPAGNSLDVSFLSGGIYILRVKDNRGIIHISKIVKK